MLQRIDAQAVAEMRPLDEAGDVGDDEAPRSPASTTPKMRDERRERIIGDHRPGRRDFRDQGGLCRRSGNPISPTSAMSFSSSTSSFSSPGLPGSCSRGTWCVAVAKDALPRPPFPPLAARISGRGEEDRRRTSPVSIVLDDRADGNAKLQVGALFSLAVAALAVRPRFWLC